MKNKNKRVKIIYVTVAIIIGILIWWNIPTSITNIELSQVKEIKIFDGNTGTEVSITDKANIEHIIENLNSVSVKKEKISLGYVGYSFRTSIYKTDGSVYKEFIINSSDTIRKDPFFYRDSTNGIDYNYIQKLVDKEKE